MPLPIPAGTWTIDPAHSSVEFVIRHLGLSKVRGRFNEFTATLVVGETLDDSTLDATIELASVDTNNADRDAHLRSTDFFGVEGHPSMRFSSTAIEEAGGDGAAERFTVTGDLTLNGHTHPVELDVTFNGTEQYPMDGSTHAGFSATAAISRKAWGVEFDVPLAAGGVVLGDTVRIELEVQLQHVEQREPAASA